MRTRFLFLSLFIALFGFAGCDTFLTRHPEDVVTNRNFWKSENDLKIYANTFYPFIVGHGNGGYGRGGRAFWDNQSDNMAPAAFNTVAAGRWNIPSGEADPLVGVDWDWGYLRRVNYFLAHYQKADLAAEIKNSYAGEARFFRAWFYFRKVKTFGAVPWVSKPLTTDSEKLFASRTPRKMVMDSVLADINFAIAHLPPMAEAAPGRIHREAALALKARIFLFEGTFRKYHSLGDWRPMLEEAAQAAKRLIDSGKFAIYSTGHPHQDYYNLFVQDSYAENPEIIYAKKYVLDKNSHAVGAYLESSTLRNGVTKSLVRSYLCTDGLPIALSPLYKGDETLKQELINRDPRLTQTIADPDTSDLFGGMPVLPGMSGAPLTTTGYQIIKWSPPTDETGISGVIDYPVFRYGETLLIYAEVKAVLGEITQQDLDRSINKLRDRVGMPHMVLGNIPNDPNSLYSDVSPLIAEIRRERRVELALEGFRWWDLMRWKAGPLLEGDVLGMKFNPEEYPNVNVGSEIYLTEEGYISVYEKALPAGREWHDRMYLFPIPTKVLSLNESLKQNPGW